MNTRHYVSALAMTALFMMPLGMNAQYVQKDCYMFGFAASFSDSTVYITDIQHIDSSYVGRHNKFLYGRDQYSYQLRDYLKEKGFVNPTCITSFSTNQKEIEKKYLKLKRRYIKNGGYNFKYISVSEFNFSPQRPDPNVMVVNGGSQGRGK